MSVDLGGPRITERPGGVGLTVKVVPGASCTRVAGVWEDALRLTISAPPESGKANAAIVDLLADVFGLRRSDVHIVSGQSRPLKRVLLAQLTVAEARARLSRVLRLWIRRPRGQRRFNAER